MKRLEMEEEGRKEKKCYNKRGGVKERGVGRRERVEEIVKETGAVAKIEGIRRIERRNGEGWGNGMGKVC